MIFIIDAMHYWYIGITPIHTIGIRRCGDIIRDIERGALIKRHTAIAATLPRHCHRHRGHYVLRHYARLLFRAIPETRLPASRHDYWELYGCHYIDIRDHYRPRRADSAIIIDFITIIIIITPYTYFDTTHSPLARHPDIIMPYYDIIILTLLRILLLLICFHLHYDIILQRYFVWHDLDIIIAILLRFPLLLLIIIIRHAILRHTITTLWYYYWWRLIRHYAGHCHYY